MLNRTIQLLVLIFALSRVCGGGEGRGSLFAADAFVVEDGVDHVQLLESLDRSAFERGKRIYSNLCVNCHGADGKTPSLPIARAFGVGPFKFGSDPFSMYQTLKKGNGLMGAQSWMTPEERYDVIHYIREAFMKSSYSDYQAIDQVYLSRFPEDVGSVTRSGTSEKNHRDFGGGLSSQLRVNRSDGSVSNHPSVLSVRLSGSKTIAYDLHRMQQAAMWGNGFLDLSQTQHERPRGEFLPTIDGTLEEGLQEFGWLFHGVPRSGRELLSASQLLAPRGPLPKHLMDYKGHYVSGDRFVLSYRIHDRKILERPRGELDINGVTHSFRVGPGTSEISLLVARGLDRGSHIKGGLMTFEALEPSRQSGEADGTVAMSSTGMFDAPSSPDGSWVAGSARGNTEGLRWKIDSERRLILQIPPSDQSREFQVTRSAGKGSASFFSFVGFLRIQELRNKEISSVLNDTKGGALRWEGEIATSVRRGNEGLAYEKDEIMLPEPNPWNAWMRTAALGFFQDGRMAVSTHGGDVWIVSNLETASPKWKRFAAGLYEPFGLKVIRDQIYVTCKDRIVRLHDLNGNNEADFYESFYADWDVSMFFHAFNFDLQIDNDGNLYYAKSGQYTDFRLPGAVIKVSPDGKTSEVVATGFRTPNGLGMLPDGRVTLGDNQGNWIPASKISVIRPGGFYGYVNNLERKGRWAPDGGRLALDRVPVPTEFEAPLIWMPQEIDSSCGGQVWVGDDRWGPLSGRMIHSSFGKARIFYLMLQEFDDIVQGAMVRLPFQFQAGVQRARVNPADGQLYLVGLHGWNGGWPKELGEMQHGGVYRIRYTGKELKMVSNVSVQPNALVISFNFPVDRKQLKKRSVFEVTAWNYRWTQRYGSDQFSTIEPERKGRDRLTVDQISLNSVGNEITLSVPELRPCHQLLLNLNIPCQGGAEFHQEILFTINGIPESGSN